MWCRLAMPQHVSPLREFEKQFTAEFDYRIEVFGGEGRALEGGRGVGGEGGVDERPHTRIPHPPGCLSGGKPGFPPPGAAGPLPPWKQARQLEEVAANIMPFWGHRVVIPRPAGPRRYYFYTL